MEQLLRQHRAGSGDIRVSLMWNNKNDINFHVVDPSAADGSERGLSSPQQAAE